MSGFTPFPFDRPVSDTTANDLLDLSGLLAALWRRGLYIIAAAAVGMIVALFWATRFTTPLYNATAVLVLEPSPEPNVDLEAVVPGLTGDNSAINTELEILASRTLLTRVVTALELASDVEFNPRLSPSTLEPIFAKLRALGLWPALPPFDPELDARLVVTATVDRLMSKLSVRNVPDSMIFEVTVQSPDRKKAALIANTLSEFYIERQVELKFAANTTALSWLSVRVEELGRELEVAEKAASAFAAQMQIINPNTIEALQGELAEVRQRIDAIETARARSASSSTSQRQLDEFTARETALAQKILQQSQDLVQLAQLQRIAESNRIIYESFLSRLKETSVQQGVQQPDSAILSTAEVAEFPAHPQPVLAALVGAVLMMAMTIIVILRQETGRQTFRTPDELQFQFPMPVLGQVRAAKRGLGRLDLPQLIARQDAPIQDDIRSFRTAFLSRPAHKKILVTSSTSGEGKTTQALLFAASLAELGKSVLVIEADLRRPTVLQQFGSKAVATERSLANVLSGGLDLKRAILRPKAQRFFVLPAGKSNTNPASALAGKGMANLLADAAGMFDHIVIDAPPVLAAPDANVLSALADQIIYVVRWQRTSRFQLRRGVEALSTAQAKVTGFMMTQIRPSFMRKLGVEEYKA